MPESEKRKCNCEHAECERKGLHVAGSCPFDAIEEKRIDMLGPVCHACYERYPERDRVSPIASTMPPSGSIVVRFYTLGDAFALAKTETFPNLTTATAAVEAYATEHGYSHVKLVDEDEDGGLRWTGRTPGGRHGRNIAASDGELEPIGCWQSGCYLTVDPIGCCEVHGMPPVEE